MARAEPRLLGVVLCGGHSVRMGRDKAELEIEGGVSFLDHACQRLDSVCDDVSVSASTERRSKYRVIADPPESNGPMTGVLTSLRFASEQDYDACVFTPVDTPQLTAANVLSLIDEFRNNSFRCDPRRIVCAISDDDSQRLQPLIAVYPVCMIKPLSRCFDERRFSLRRFLENQSFAKIKLPASACENINTPSDLQRYTSQS